MSKITHNSIVRVKSGFYKGLEGRPHACVKFFLWFPEYLVGNKWFFSYELDVVKENE